MKKAKRRRLCEKLRRIFTVKYAEAPRPIEKICEIIEEYKKENKIENVEAISIGVPSSVENDKETVICTTNICDENGEAVFTHTNLAKDIREHFQIPVYINNDVNNILMYDIVSNHLENQKVIVGIYIGTGVGASVVIDGRPLEGKNGQSWIWATFHILEAMRSAAAAREGAANVMLPAGVFSRYARSIIRTRRSRKCLQGTEKKDL